MRCYALSWWGAKWQLINCKYLPNIFTFIDIAPLFPNKLQQKPALRTVWFMRYVWSLCVFNTNTELWSPCRVWVANKWYLNRYFFNVDSHWGFESQKNAQNKDISHYWVPMKMTSGSEAKCSEVKNCSRYFYGGIDPYRFHVTESIFKCEGVVSRYYYELSFMFYIYLFHFWL